MKELLQSSPKLPQVILVINETLYLKKMSRVMEEVPEAWTARGRQD